MKCSRSPRAPGMRNFFIGIAVGVVFCGLTLVILLVASVRFAASFADRTPPIADGSTLVLDLQGEIPERLPAEIPIPLLQSPRALSVTQVWDALRRASSDS